VLKEFKKYDPDELAVIDPEVLRRFNEDRFLKLNGIPTVEIPEGRKFIYIDTSAVIHLLHCSTFREKTAPIIDAIDVANEISEHLIETLCTVIDKLRIGQCVDIIKEATSERTNIQYLLAIAIEERKDYEALVHQLTVNMNDDELEEMKREVFQSRLIEQEREECLALSLSR